MNTLIGYKESISIGRVEIYRWLGFVWVEKVIVIVLISIIVWLQILDVNLTNFIVIT